jgi:hypothetical protein
MTTREEYAEAAEWIEKWCVNLPPQPAHPHFSIAVCVLRALAEGAVLCEETEPPRLPVFGPYYRPIEEQP